MPDDNNGGMFSKLINPDTAKPKTAPEPDQGKAIAPEERVGAKIGEHSPSTQKSKPKLAVKTTKTPKKDLKSKKRRQISAYFTPDQLIILKQLYFKLNEGEGKIEKSEILGLAVEILSKLLGTQVPKYSSIYQVREHLDTQVSKYLSTQVPKDSST